jgi:Mpv17 / PMP22 family
MTMRTTTGTTSYRRLLDVAAAGRRPATGAGSAHPLVVLCVLLLAGSHHVQPSAAFSLEGWGQLLVHHAHHAHHTHASIPFLAASAPNAFLHQLLPHGPAATSHHLPHLTSNSHHPDQLVAVLKHQFDGVLHAYRSSLREHPLATKTATGGTLAVVGDAVAQRRQASTAASSSSNADDDDNGDQASTAAAPSSYDSRRAASFMAFDMAYRALQHYLFPLLVAHCHGQLLSQLLPHQFVDTGVVSTEYLAAMERTLGSQLGIVPFLYYPVFFAFTGFLQGLTAQSSWSRAVDNFPALMKRNLAFWIPVQFVQFMFVPDDLQIPFLSAAGLCWTFILSMAAGSAKAYATTSSVAAATSASAAPPGGGPPLMMAAAAAGAGPEPTTADVDAVMALEGQSSTTATGTAAEVPNKQAPVAA